MQSIKERINFYLPRMAVDGLDFFFCYRCRFFSILFAEDGGIRHIPDPPTANPQR